MATQSDSDDPGRTETPSSQAERNPLGWRKRHRRMLLYLAVLLAIAAWKFVPRPWRPALTLETPHHTIYSTATREQTKATANALTALYQAYSNRFRGRFASLGSVETKFKVKLFKDRAEFRWVNPNLGWAEAFYRKPYCRAYYSAKEVNPYHWMLHEAVHQLNREAAGLKLEKWLEEGLAEYFSTSRLTATNLSLGQIDMNTYPVWWIDELATSPDLVDNLRNGSVIPLRAIVTGRSGPSMNAHFNLYYLHWWTLTHYLFEIHGDRALDVVEQGGSLAALEKILGPIDHVQSEWHAHVQQLKVRLAVGDLRARVSTSSGTNAFPADANRE
jgi:hypothetical protein